jgi:uncharacterized OsmC-like protein
MDLRATQQPLKERYRSDPDSARIKLTANSDQTDTPMACSLQVGQKIVEAQAHSGVGGAGSAACSGDLLLGALAACAQLTCQLVATAMNIPFEHISVEVVVGFDDIHARFHINAPDATEKQLATLKEKTEQYCVVMQTLLHPPAIRTSWNGSE